MAPRRRESPYTDRPIVMLMVPENWASLKREATTLEAYIEKRLHDREGGGVSGNAVPPPTTLDHLESGTGMAHPGVVRLREIDESLGQLTTVVERLGSMATAAASSSNLAVAQRFRDVLGGLRNEHRSQNIALRQRMEAAALLGPREGGGGGRGGGGGGADDSVEAALLRERGSLQGHGRAIDDLLAQAAVTTDALRSQRGVIMASAGKLGGFLTALPGASQLMAAISTRRSRNDYIVFSAIALCVCYSVWHVFLRKY